MTIPNPVTGRALWKYFADYAGVSKMPADDFYTLVKDLPCFKRVNHGQYGHTYRAVANLIIPAGTLVYAPAYAFSTHSDRDDRKMRAEKARVVSLHDARGVAIKSAHSMYNYDFKYRSGKVVKPDAGFCGFQDQCAAGIHFFLNVHDAVNYD